MRRTDGLARRAPQAESDLDEIWYFLAAQSSGIDVADRVIDSTTARFALLARQPYIGRRWDEDRGRNPSVPASPDRSITEAA